MVSGPKDLQAPPGLYEEHMKGQLNRSRSVTWDQMMWVNKSAYNLHEWTNKISPEVRVHIISFACR